ncbi:hypothetical protein [Arthrobacter sp. EpRS71]|uniref:hypothetical protein n=1 Tax=Arthrobacter sp. EpRS71 TaxID=1743141 RepID=UPI00074A7FBF|nr:hypothetical protein [Arthrobacter sp. EpRS71]KUM38980.1 hypothetical protein AR689_07450 [Arthrobacter sp. EpRS71]
MSERLPESHDNLNDQLRELLEHGGQPVHAILGRINLFDPVEVREAVEFCQQHIFGQDVTAIYVQTPDGLTSKLETMKRLSLRDIESVGCDDEGNVYLIRKTDLNNQNESS